MPKILNTITTFCRGCMKVIPVRNPVALVMIQSKGRPMCGECRDEVAKDGYKRSANGK